MDDLIKTKIEVLKAQMDALRKEVQGRIETDYTIWKLTFAGIAGVIVLKDNICLEDYLPLAPILAMALVHVAITEMFYIFQNGYALARCEQQINGLLNDGKLLGHELSLSRARIEGLLYWSPLVQIGIGAAAVIQWTLLRFYLPCSKFKGPTLSIPLYAVSIALPLLAFITFRRMVRLARENRSSFGTSLAAEAPCVEAKTPATKE
jgi:hypothetical protein